jgi:hypothetical protein
MDDNRGSSKLPVGVIAACLGAIGGALSVLLARRESREYIREKGAKGVEYLNQTGTKLRERTEGIVGKGRELISGYCGSGENKSETTTSGERRDDVH